MHCFLRRCRTTWPAAGADYVAGTYGAWCSDLARTYSTGEPTAQQREAYAALWEIETATINMVRPSMPAEEPFYFCKQSFEKAS